MVDYKKLTVAEMQALLKDPAEQEGFKAWRDGALDAISGGKKRFKHGVIQKGKLKKKEF